MIKLNQKSKFLLGALCLLQLLGTCKCNQNLMRIVGGSETGIGNVPYLVQMWHKGVFTCGGALIAPRFVVTAAHCTVDLKPGQLTVVGGTSTLSGSGIRRGVTKIIRPKGFSMKNFNRDVAVLKLNSPLTGSNISTIPLNTQPLSVGMSLKVSGWGRINENANNVSNQLRTVTVPIVGKSRCAAQYRNYIPLTGSMFCAASPGKDACSGDSGGPAVCNGRLCGIVSFGKGCARSNYPGVYTSIRSVQSLIRSSLTK
ncbi:seminase-like [Haematobia irritans]|uniref:seminase-like n=1 Tax=Haematobia irritans TaxID=7368 RepID=UPI003F4FAABA